MIRPRPASVYRLYDAEGSLLYIGSTRDVLGRWQDHRRSQPWWAEVVRMEIVKFPDWPLAVVAEMEAIEQELPRYNVSGNPAKRQPEGQPDILILILGRGFTGATVPQLAWRTRRSQESIRDELIELAANGHVTPTGDGRWRVLHSKATFKRIAELKRMCRELRKAPRPEWSVQRDHDPDEFAGWIAYSTSVEEGAKAPLPTQADRLEVLATAFLGTSGVITGREAMRRSGLPRSWVFEVGLPELERTGRIERLTPKGWRATDAPAIHLLEAEGGNR